MYTVTAVIMYIIKMMIYLSGENRNVSYYAANFQVA